MPPAVLCTWGHTWLVRVRFAYVDMWHTPAGYLPHPLLRHFVLHVAGGHIDPQAGVPEDIDVGVHGEVVRAQLSDDRFAQELSTV